MLKKITFLKVLCAKKNFNLGIAKGIAKSKNLPTQKVYDNKWNELIQKGNGNKKKYP